MFVLKINSSFAGSPPVKLAAINKKLRINGGERWIFYWKGKVSANIRTKTLKKRI